MAAPQRRILPKIQSDSESSSLSQRNRSPSGSERRRGAIACRPCQIRRSKCDGNRPTCRTCTARNTPCEYDISPGQTRAEARKQKIKRTESDNSSMSDILHFLQTTTMDEAQQFLEYIQQDPQVNVASMQDWIRDRQTGSSQAATPFAELERLLNSSIHESPDSLIKTQSDAIPHAQGQSHSSDSIHAPANVSPYRARTWREPTTVATIKHAIDYFYSCTGMLFYVFTKEQIESVYEEAFGHIDYPEQTPFADAMRIDMNRQQKGRVAELCGMAAVGVLYIRMTDSENSPPSTLADYLYSVVRRSLEDAISDNPLRAMKLCALLTMYNLVLKATVAIAYTEMGLGLGRDCGIGSNVNPRGMDAEEFMDYKRTWRTLILFSGWLGSSLGYIPAFVNRSAQLPGDEADTEPEDIIQRELVKVTILKAKITCVIPVEQSTSSTVISNLRKELRTFYEELPEWMAITTLVNEREANPLRQIVFNFHLFYLSALQLLHRRIFACLECFRSPSGGISQQATAAIKEGLMAAKMAARVLGLMLQEGHIAQICWMCIFTSYNAAILILHAAIQKVLVGHQSALWLADLTLVNICADCLKYCSHIDNVAGRFRNTVCKYLEVIHEIVDGKMNDDPSENIDEDQPLEYLFESNTGESVLHMAAQDLLYLVERPFGRDLKLMPVSEDENPYLHNLMLNWMETAIRDTEECNWHIKRYGGKVANQEESPGGAGQNESGDAMIGVASGHFDTMETGSAWSVLTPDAF